MSNGNGMWGNYTRHSGRFDIHGENLGTVINPYSLFGMIVGGK